ncbi:MAG: TIGR02253 family HAD-type hydrolase [Planctomycetota bacterium]|nr:TIGR02253 family HAD-type hydrolase [Planctomycetota bacterium]
MVWSRQGPRLKAIFFDIDDTLFSTSEFARRARRNSLEAMIQTGLRIDLDDLEAELTEIIAEFSSNYDQHFDKLLLRIPRKHYRGVNPAIIVAAGVVAYHQTKFMELKPYDDVPKVLERLSQVSELVLGVITHGLAVKQSEKLIRLGIYGFLDANAIFISEQIGISKPNPKLYQRALSDLNLKPAEAMYIGDRPTHDIDPPNGIGMITVRNRRGGYRDEVGVTEPDFEIDSFDQLEEIVTQMLKDPSAVKTSS